MEEKGFIGRASHQLKFIDITELAIASILISKIEDVNSSTIVHIQFSLFDFFPYEKSLKELSSIICGKKATSKDRNSEYLVDFFNFTYKANIQPAIKEVDLVHFYNEYLGLRFHYLKEGDSVGLKPCIEDWHIDEKYELHNYTISLIPNKFIKIHSENILLDVSLKEKALFMFQDKVNELGAGISYRKQMEFALEYFEERQKMTGEKQFEFNLKEIKYRHLLSYTDDGNERLTLPMPLTTDASTRINIPFFMESIGLIDINRFKITSSPLQIENIDVSYFINKPAIKNNYLAKSFGLNANRRKSLSESQIEIFERIHKELSEKACFLGRPKIEEQFSDVFYWILKKVSICLEEPSFLKDKSVIWLDENKNKKYVQMEDNFFLPFLHERLKDEFGDLIIKKPERFGGEIDLLYSELPLELKVRRNVNDRLADIIDEKYSPASQAATYAAITRLGFVLVLDLPHNKKGITNLDACFKLIEKDFGDNSLSTNIVVCTFYCNLPTPSSAK